MTCLNEFSGMAKHHLVIRADANAQMGTGHLMRCLALAQAWHDPGEQVHFVLATEASALEARLTAEGMRVHHIDAMPGSTADATQAIRLAQQVEAPWIVLDGYHFDATYQRIVKEARLRLLFIDDYGHSDHYCADIVLNQNIYAHEGLYVHREPYTHLLLGTRYALLRREFWPWRNWRREIPEVARKILVTLGGSDPDNETLKVVQAIQRLTIGGKEAVVVIGGSNPHYHELESAVHCAQEGICLERDVMDMTALIAWADVAVSGGGSTCWELAFMGLPALVVVLAENQRLIAEGLDSAKVALNLGWREEVTVAQIQGVLTDLLTSAEIRAVMANQGQRLVDGEGGYRVKEVIFQGAGD